MGLGGIGGCLSVAFCGIEYRFILFVIAIFVVITTLALTMISIPEKSADETVIVSPAVFSRCQSIRFSKRASRRFRLTI